MRRTRCRETGDEEDSTPGSSDDEDKATLDLIYVALLDIYFGADTSLK